MFFFLGRWRNNFFLNKLEKHHHKRRSVSPSGLGDQSLYSDQETQRKERREPSDGQQDRSRSQSPTLASRSKQDGIVDGDQQQPSQSQQQQTQVVEGSSGDAPQGGVARSEEEQAVGETEKRRSGSKKRSIIVEIVMIIIIFHLHKMLLTIPILIILFNNNHKQLTLENIKMNYLHN